MDDPVHRAGQEAARYGVPLSACPLMKEANMPGRTGESLPIWRARLASWEAGWREETEARLAELHRRRLIQQSFD
ncbi:CrpP-related protein [Achromobacter sp.]|uniref:CrpP-related protein n=1 Tax=Achromobacter sp. TaxID=134375 RepID=UPI00390C816E